MPPKKNAKHEAVAGDITNFDEWVDDIKKDVKSVQDITNTIEWISSGMVAANLALSGHPGYGLPFGCIINMEGLSDSGKSLMAQTACREAQEKYRERLRALYITSERGMFTSRLEQMGLCVKRKSEDPKNDKAGTFKPIQTTNLTDLADDILPGFFKSADEHPEMRFMLVFDSISMLMTDHERESDFNTQDMARAKELRKFMRILNDSIRPNIMILLIHHQTHKINTNPGIPLPPTQGSRELDIGGGTAMKYVPDVRIQINFAGKEKRGSGEDAETVGQKCRIETIKTRLYKPMIKATLTIDHSCGFTQLGGLSEQLEDLKLVDEVGQGWWICKPIFGDKKFQGWNKLQDELEKPENVRRVVDLIVENLKFETFAGEQVAVNPTVKAEKA